MKIESSSRANGLAMSLGLLAGGAFLASVLAACAATSQGQVALQQPPAAAQAASGGQPAPSGAAQFLGSDAALLQPGAEGQAAYVYINPNVQWSNYKKVLLKPIEFWDSPDTSVSPDDQKMLTSYFYNSLQTNVQQEFHYRRSAGAWSDHLRGRDYQCGNSHARFAIGFPGHPAGSHIELRAIACDRPRGLRRFCRGGLQGHGFEHGTVAGGIGRQAHRRYGGGQCGADPVGRRRGRDGLLVGAYHPACSRARSGHAGSNRPALGEQLGLPTHRRKGKVIRIRFVRLLALLAIWAFE